jgi:DtxR family Mn-dependent transcriptional regulator
MAQGHSIDTYLETIYMLAFPVGEYGPVVKDSPALASRVADMLHVSRASAGEMLKRLEHDGLIERGQRKEVVLTPAGRDAAERVIRRHRLIERFLTDFLGYTAAEAHEGADELADTFSDDMIERMRERLGNPDRCPHGWPVDPAVEQAENLELSALADLEPGERATIVRLAEHDGELLHWFYAEGLVPGTDIELHSAQPSAGQLVVAIGGAERAIGERAASGLFVRRAA